WRIANAPVFAHVRAPVGIQLATRHGDRRETGYGPTPDRPEDPPSIRRDFSGTRSCQPYDSNRGDHEDRRKREPWRHETRHDERAARPNRLAFAVPQREPGQE